MAITHESQIINLSNVDVELNNLDMSIKLLDEYIGLLEVGCEYAGVQNLIIDGVNKFVDSFNSRISAAEIMKSNIKTLRSSIFNETRALESSQRIEYNHYLAEQRRLQEEANAEQQSNGG